MTVVASVCINMPDKTPAVRIRNTAGVTSFTPSVITVTVSFKDSPPNNPPTIAPIIRLYVEATEALNRMGFTAVLPIQPFPVTLEEAMRPEFTKENIERTVRQVVRIIKQFTK